MNLKLFNVCLLLGWLMVLVGGIIINVGWGIALGGVLLLFLVLLTAYFAGLHAPDAAAKPDAATGQPGEPRA